MALHAEISGEPAGKLPLVLLHGFGGSASVWPQVVSRLEGAAQSIAYDLPGHRHSLSETPGGAGRMAKRLLADLEERGLTRVHLCGHSLGGATAALMAMRAPERVASLTLLAPGGFGPEINGAALADWRDAADGPSLATALKAMTAPGFSVLPATIESLVEARSCEGAAAALAEIYTTLFAEEGRQGCLPMQALAECPCPINILWGTDDPILPAAQTIDLPDRFAVERLEGAGHMLIEERPESVIAALRRQIGDPLKPV